MHTHTLLSVKAQPATKPPCWTITKSLLPGAHSRTHEECNLLEWYLNEAEGQKRQIFKSIIKIEAAEIPHYRDLRSLERNELPESRSRHFS